MFSALIFYIELLRTFVVCFLNCITLFCKMLRTICIHLTNVNCSSLELTDSQFCKNVRKVFLKPLPTFCWLGHVLAILQTKHEHSAMPSTAISISNLEPNKHITHHRTDLTSVGKEHTAKKAKPQSHFENEHEKNSRILLNA